MRAFIERTFAKTFPSDLEPAQIARKLVSTMEARTRGAEGGLAARVVRGARQYRTTTGGSRQHQRIPRTGWADLLRELAGRVGIVFTDGDAKVRMTARESVPLGAVEVAVVAREAPAFSPSDVKGRLRGRGILD